jgi:flagellar protein FlaG
MIVPHVNGPNLDPQAVGRGKDDGASRTTPAVAVAGVLRSATASESTRTDAAPQPSRSPSSEELKEAVKAINRAMQQSNRNLEFSVDEDTDRLVVKLTDRETGELIRQFPSEETLAISRSIGEFQQGFLLKQKA